MKKTKPKINAAAVICVCIAAAALLAVAAIVTTNLTAQKAPGAGEEQTVEPAAPPVVPVTPQSEFVPDARLIQANEINPDAVGWLTLKGCDVDNVVFQGADNDYYLRKNENGDYDVWGCYFLDYINATDGFSLYDRVSIIYGHALDDYEDSERFSKLKRYKSAEFARDNPVISLSLLHGELKYQAFAACNMPVSIDYIDPNPDDGKYQETLSYMLENSYVDFGVDVGTGDRILVLSTCTSDETIRFIVAAKLISA